MTIDSSARVKNQVRDSIEHGFDGMHRVADAVTFPLAAVDGAIHGVARGVLNWLTDTHPEDRKKKCKPGHAAPPPPPNPYYSAPAPPSAYAQSYPYAYNYGYPPPPPPPPGPLPPQSQNNPGYLFYEKQQSRTSTWTSSDSNGYYPGRPGN
ncbi:hypothetical protein QQP08_014983 [Theobroma cacao]|nr:hypothetical protein QQP08_014983 [Theobroma cacao]